MFKLAEGVDVVIKVEIKEEQEQMIDEEMLENMDSDSEIPIVPPSISQDYVPGSYEYDLGPAGPVSTPAIADQLFGRRFDAYENQLAPCLMISRENQQAVVAATVTQTKKVEPPTLKANAQICHDQLVEDYSKIQDDHTSDAPSNGTGIATSASAATPPITTTPLADDLDSCSSIKDCVTKKRKRTENSEMFGRKTGVADLLSLNLDESIKLDRIEDLLHRQLEEDNLVKELNVTVPERVGEMDIDQLKQTETDRQKEKTFDWENFASDSLRKFEVELGFKQRKYEALTEKKEVVMMIMEKAQEIKHAREENIVQVSAEIKVKEKIIENCEEEIRNLKQAIEEENEKMEKINVFLCQETKKVENSGELIKKIYSVVEQVEFDIKSACQVNEGKTEPSEANVNLKTPSGLDQFLADCISDKEKQLRCLVCTKMSSPPIYKCPAEHLLCSSCYSQVKTRCPTCGIWMDKIGMLSRFKTAEIAWEDWKKMNNRLNDSVE